MIHPTAVMPEMRMNVNTGFGHSARMGGLARRTGFGVRFQWLPAERSRVPF